VKHRTKLDFPVSKVRRYLEPGPIVLVSSHWQGKHNIMTLGWHTVLEFSPSLVGCMISGGNHSFEMIRNSRECVINLPTTNLTDPVVRIGNTTGANIDKFSEFGLTAEQAHLVEAPLIAECHASFECRLFAMRTWISTISSSSRWAKPMPPHDQNTRHLRTKSIL
jgi:flavin reductase (DIM6/NTAB) family NADH-FMN oxidoreductase RutF